MWRNSLVGYCGDVCISFFSPAASGSPFSLWLGCFLGWVDVHPEGRSHYPSCLHRISRATTVPLLCTKGRPRKEKKRYLKEMPALFLILCVFLRSVSLFAEQALQKLERFLSGRNSQRGVNITKDGTYGPFLFFISSVHGFLFIWQRPCCPSFACVTNKATFFLFFSGG